VYLSRREGYHRAESAVDLRNNEHLTPAFRAINPDATVPVLELDNGTRITDAIGICVYFEAIQPRKRRRSSPPGSGFQSATGFMR
jgi:glutathione S-transferase